MRCYFLFCYQCFSWWSPTLYWPYGCCCTLLFVCKPVLRPCFRYFSWDPLPGDLGLFYSSVWCHLPPVHRDLSSTVRHIHHVAPSALTVLSYGWYWMCAICRSFLRWTPSRSAESTTHFCKYFCPSVLCMWWTCRYKAICTVQVMERAQGVH